MQALCQLSYGPVLRPGGLPQCSRGEGVTAKPFEGGFDGLAGRAEATPAWL
jgi:hypothetical protein